MSRYTVAVRYGLMMNTEQFLTETGTLRVGDDVVLRTERGIEYGYVSAKPVATDREIKGLGEVVRPAGPDDRAVMRHIHDTREPEAFRTGRECIREHKLDMRLVGVEYLFGGEKLVFYFIADGRVDFRALVKDLARRFRTRIEMRQIGVRDEARILADHEHCGRELCCRTFIRQLEPVTMRMAKTQKTTLDPTKISGHCGRLMCCLRFEDAVYTQLQSEMPPRGATVATASLSGEVIACDILKQEVTLVLPDGSRETIRRETIVEIRQRARGQGSSPSHPPLPSELAGDSNRSRRGPPRDRGGNRPERPDRPDRSERPGPRGERSERSDRGNRPERQPNRAPSGAAVPAEPQPPPAPPAPSGGAPEAK